MASRRDVSRTSRSDPKQPSEAAPTVYPPESGAKRRSGSSSATTAAKAERTLPPREAPTPDAMAQASAGNAPTQVTHEARYRMICEAAYLRAERRGFMPGGEIEDWLAAEVEVDRLLKAEHVSTPQ